ncbi:MAG: hypothetical protein AAFV71_04690 [Cyanobacteria bacterium J06633_8]
MDLLSIFDYSQLLDVIAQTPTPTPISTAAAKETVDTITLLKTQLDFLKFVIQVAVFVFAVLGAWITFVFGKNLTDAKKVAEEIISEKVKARVDNLIKTEVQSLKRSIDREKAIIFTYVDYYLPSSTIEPKEVKLLKARGFRDVFFWNRHNPPKRLSGNVCVLDLQNYKDDSGKNFSELAQNDKETKVETYINEILPLLPPETVLVIYARGRFNAIENIPNNTYYVPANSVVTLMGWVADSAYVAYGEEIV